MPNDTLTDSIKSLCLEVENPANRSVNFVAPRILELVESGFGLQDIENALRISRAPIFLVGLPWTGERNNGRKLFHPDVRVEAAGLRFSLWIGINGEDEVDRLLARHSQSSTANLSNLNATGFIETDAPETTLFSGSSVTDIVKWLILEAPTWTARRETVLTYQDLLSTGEALNLLRSLEENADLDANSREVMTEMRELLEHLSLGGPSLAFGSCKFLVLEALLAFIGASSWQEAGNVYAFYENELGGELALELLSEMASQTHYTASALGVIEAHSKVLESAWDCGIETAISGAVERYPVKSGTQTIEDYLQTYLRAPDLEEACQWLRKAPAFMLQLSHDAIMAGIKRTNTDELWRIGLLEGARDEGIDESYNDWSNLQLIESISDWPEARRRLGPFLERDCTLRDRALELLLQLHIRAGDEESQQSVIQELVDHRSNSSPFGRRPIDLTDLGVVSSKRGDLATARFAFREARCELYRLRDRSARAAIWLKSGIFYRDYEQDVALALHSFRVAADEFARAEDVVSIAYSFEQLSSMYRSLGRFDLAAVYADLAQGAIVSVEDNQYGVAGSCFEVKRDVEKGVAITEFLLGEFGSAIVRLKELLNALPLQGAEGERVALERIAFASMIENGDWNAAEGILTTWQVAGQEELALIGRTALTFGESAQAGSDDSTIPAQAVDLIGVAEALRRLNGDKFDVEFLDNPKSQSALRDLLVDKVAGITRSTPSFATRVFGDLESASWVSRAERAVATARIEIGESDQPEPLPLSAPWPQILARYDCLGVWDLPDLAVLGPILDRWSLRSRFKNAALINPVPPRDGFLNVYFYRADPEGHLSGSARGCVYIPDGDLILCSLSYLEDLFRVGRADWTAETEKIKKALVEGNFGDPAKLAVTLANALRSRERILLEWVIAHEIGHAHYRHSAPASDAVALAYEDQADSFFLDGIAVDGGLGEILHSLFGQFSLLYEYDCENQFARALTVKEVEDRSVRLDPTPDVSGHRPLIFRAVKLVKSILKIDPSLESESYIDEFAKSLEGR